MCLRTFLSTSLDAVADRRDLANISAHSLTWFEGTIGSDVSSGLESQMKTNRFKTL
jgi:hypothetical protein